MTKTFSILFLLLFTISCKKAVQSPGFENISVQDLTKIQLDYPNLKVLDLRTPTECAKGKITTDAIEINFFDDNFEDQLKKLNLEDPYIIYCKSGGRSSKTYALMEKLGFQKVFHLDGGFKAWSSK